MKRYLPVLLLSGVVLAQVPSLSTSDKVALSALEHQKEDAGKAYSLADQQEKAIEQEWASAHPGFHLDPKTFLPTPDSKPVNAPEKK